MKMSWKPLENSRTDDQHKPNRTTTEEGQLENKGQLLGQKGEGEKGEKSSAYLPKLLPILTFSFVL
jgi:hypothetical protein